MGKRISLNPISESVMDIVSTEETQVLVSKKEKAMDKNIFTIKAVGEGSIKNNSRVGLTFFRNDKELIYAVRVITDLNAPFLNLGYDQKRSKSLQSQINQEIESSISAAADFFHYQYFDMTEGCHILDNIEMKSPEGKAGYVASWCRSPKFIHLAPRTDGWHEIGYRKIGKNTTYYVRGWAHPNAALKHDYMDMMLLKSANFHIIVPKWLQKVEETEDGKLRVSWIERIWNNTQLGQAEARADHKEGATNAVMSGAFYTGLKRDDEGDLLPSSIDDSKPLMVQTREGQEIDLTKKDVVNLYLYYSKDAPKAFKRIRWDKSEDAKALLSRAFEMKAVFSLQ